jgi:hypothetical protein
MQSLKVYSMSIVNLSRATLILANNSVMSVGSGSEIQLRNQSQILCDETSNIFMDRGSVRVIEKGAHLQGNFTNNSGNLDCGFDIVTFYINGSYTQAAQGTLILRKIMKYINI